jgi:putative ABC transport system substrate-binding protein
LANVGSPSLDHHRMKPPHAIGRRTVARIAAGLALARPSLAAAAGPFRIAIPTLTLTRSAPQFVAFETALRNAGWRDKLTIDLVEVRGGVEGYAPALRDIVRRGADIIVVSGSEAGMRAARDSTKTIPIVVLAFDFDPVATGYVASLAHPGGNITGINVRQVELAAKRAEMLLAVAPGTRRMIVLSDTLSVGQSVDALTFLRRSGVGVTTVELRQPPYDYDAAMAGSDGKRGDALLLMTSTLIFSDCDEIAEVALQRRLPSSFGASEFPTRGGLMSYGVDTVDMWTQVAGYVDRILRGARPADLPMQQPSKFQLVINLKTAAALGLTIPSNLLALADDLIE